MLTTVISSNPGDAKKRPYIRRPYSLIPKSSEHHFRHPEDNVARERATRRFHFDPSGGRAGGHGGVDFRLRDDLECRWRTVERNAGRASQIRSHNDDFRSDLAGGRTCFHERSQPNTQTEDRAIVTGSASVGCPVEVAVGGLKQPTVRVTAVSAGEAVQRGQCATRGDSEDRAIIACPASVCCPVQPAVGGLYESCQRVVAVSAVRFGAKAVKRRQCARSGDFENCAAGATITLIATV